MPPNGGDRLNEIYRLERENNQMLRGMKRRAFWGGLLRIVIYLIMLGVPVWLFFSYLYPVVEQLNDTVGSLTGGKIQFADQLSGMNDWFKQVQAFFQGMASSTRQ
jgi:predicted PurR-regulated permease PerM